MKPTSKNARGAFAAACKGLSPEQRRLVKLYVNESNSSGWCVFRAPTTINPPTLLRLHLRNQRGKLVQVISITEDGVTKGAQ